MALSAPMRREADPPSMLSSDNSVFTTGRCLPGTGAPRTALRRIRPAVSAQFPQELLVSRPAAFIAAPLANDSQIDRLMPRDRDREAQALTILPVVESGQPVPTRIGRREQESGSASHRDLDWLDVDVSADSQRARRKLEVERNDRMDVAISPSREAQRGERGVQIRLPDRSLQDIVRVLRDVGAVRIDRDAGAAGEHCRDAVALEPRAHGQCDVGQRRLRRQPHNGFPARRGLRRSRSVCSLSSWSASARRDK